MILIIVILLALILFVIAPEFVMTLLALCFIFGLGTAFLGILGFASLM